MAIRKIVKIGDDCLRQECRKQEKFDLRLKILLKDMADTMYKAEGVGLAAPQVGVLRRVVVIDVGDQGDGLLELINPVITMREGVKSPCSIRTATACIAKRRSKGCSHARSATSWITWTASCTST